MATREWNEESFLMVGRGFDIGDFEGSQFVGLLEGR
jgi:hypothetical protein